MCTLTIISASAAGTVRSALLHIEVKVIRCSQEAIGDGVYEVPKNKAEKLDELSIITTSMLSYVTNLNSNLISQLRSDSAVLAFNMIIVRRTCMHILEVLCVIPYPTLIPLIQSYQLHLRSYSRAIGADV